MESSSYTAERRLCRYSLRHCNKSAMDGYHFCNTHILEDKNSPFQQCSYQSSKTGNRCLLPANKTQKKESFCSMHLARINRTRCINIKKQLEAEEESAETILDDLAHYSSTLYNNNRNERGALRNDINSFHQAELVSSSDSDSEDRTYLGLSHYQPDSDSDSIDSECDDPFKYAELMTEEEVTRITRDKLIKLQSLYIEQFKWLQYVLKEQRRKYLHSQTATESAKSSNDLNEDEGETSQSSSNQASNRVLLGNDPISQKYLALRRYHKRHGVEALMYQKCQERRRTLGDPGSASESHQLNKYRHSSRHGTKYCSARPFKCTERSLPFARYCSRHIELDSHQVLFRRCGFVAVEGGLACERLITNYNDYTRCHYHNNMDDLRNAQSNFSNSNDSTHDVDVVDENVPTVQPGAYTVLVNFESAPVPVLASNNTTENLNGESETMENQLKEDMAVDAMEESR